MTNDVDLRALLSGEFEKSRYAFDQFCFSYSGPIQQSLAFLPFDFTIWQPPQLVTDTFLSLIAVTVDQTSFSCDSSQQLVIRNKRIVEIDTAYPLRSRHAVPPKIIWTAAAKSGACRSRGQLPEIPLRVSRIFSARPAARPAAISRSESPII